MQDLAPEEKSCLICQLEVDSSYLLLQGKYYHLKCWVSQVQTEGELTDPLAVMLYEILTAHGV